MAYGNVTAYGATCAAFASNTFVPGTEIMLMKDVSNL